MAVGALPESLLLRPDRRRSWPREVQGAIPSYSEPAAPLLPHFSSAWCGYSAAGVSFTCRTSITAPAFFIFARIARVCRPAGIVTLPMVRGTKF